MADIRDKAAGDRNLLERLLHVIPGFSGYLGKEERRETDKILREHLAKDLDRLRTRLDPVMRDLTDAGGLALVGEADRVKKAIERVANRLRYASYGYSGFLDVVKVREEELDRLYEFDAALVDHIEELEKSIGKMALAVSDTDGFKSSARQALEEARQFDEHLDKRKKIITGAG